jgi:hypothetical protein
VQREWQALGLDLHFAEGAPEELTLPVTATHGASGALHAWPVAAQGETMVSLLQDADGNDLAVQAALGQGRIGAVWLSDSFRLVTRGDAPAHATLWSGLVTAIARPRQDQALTLPTRAVVGQRALICSPASDLQVKSPQSTPIQLLRAADNTGCAAFWPTLAGWHHLLVNPEDSSALAHDPSTATPASASPSAPPAFYVYSPESIHSLVEHQDRIATMALVNRAQAPEASPSHRDAVRAMLALSWLCLMSVSWWLERRGRQGQVEASG